MNPGLPRQSYTLAPQHPHGIATVALRPSAPYYYKGKADPRRPSLRRPIGPAVAVESELAPPDSPSSSFFSYSIH